ncbi:MAG: hypothetical protein NT032_00005, partial [Actinobacteria bacterium]|nr:hypothetical protein [Actinomycetota bacterium]
MSKSAKNYELTQDGNGAFHVPVLKAINHENKCCCPATVNKHNVEALQFMMTCVPEELTRFWRQAEREGHKTGIYKWSDASMTPKKVVNPTLTYFGEVPKCGTSIPELTYRQPLSLMSREAPRIWRPSGHGVDMKSQFPLLRAVAAQLHRKEFGRLVDDMQLTTVTARSTEEDTMRRFPPEDMQRESWDVKLRDQNVEWILNSAVLVSPFWGEYECSFCNMDVLTTCQDDLIEHLMKNHQKLRDSVFTCPGCIGVRTYTWSTYRRHYSKAHAASVAMIMVLDDVACHVRNAWALALSAVIKFFELTEQCMADPVVRERMKEGEGGEYSSTIGGYYPPKEIETLKSMIKSRQEYLLPGNMARDLKPGAERRAEGTKKRREPDANIPGGQWKIPRSRKTSEESTGYQMVERKKPRKTYSEAAVPAEKPREESSADKLDWNWECEREIAARSIAQAAQERREAERAA